MGDQQQREGYHFVLSGEALRGLALSVAVAVVTYLATAAAGFELPGDWGGWAAGLAVGLLNVIGAAVLAWITRGGFERG